MREAYDAMRTDIISAMSVIEAMIDFGEDESIHLDALEPGTLGQCIWSIIKHD